MKCPTDVDTQVRAKEDNQRSRDMNNALGAFVEGRSDPQDWWHRSGHAPINAQGHPESATDEPRIQAHNERVPMTPRATDQREENSAMEEHFAANNSIGTSEDTQATPDAIPRDQDPQLGNKCQQTKWCQVDQRLVRDMDLTALRVLLHRLIQGTMNRMKIFRP